MNFEEYRTYDGLGLAELVKQKKVTPKELLDIAIDRCEAVDPELNAVVTKFYDQAYEQIKPVDASLPFCGVPFLMKEMGCFQKGLPSTFASRTCEHYVADHTAGLVERFIASGVNIFGRTNACEYGLSYVTESELYGPARNPWNTALTPGGSSGGAAAAVAAGIVPIAQASDGGGSIRVPAACTGLFGFKPSRARISLGPDMGEMWNGLVVQFALSRSVRDSVAMLDAVRGYQPGDPYYAPPAPQSFFEAYKQPLEPLRILVATNDLAGGVPVSDESKAAVAEAVKLCESLGHQVVGDHLPFDKTAINGAARSIICANVRAVVNRMLKLQNKTFNPEELETVTLAHYECGGRYSAEDLINAVAQLQFESRKFIRCFKHFDIIVTPTLATPPIEIGKLASGNMSIEEYWDRQAKFVPYTSICNMTGQPAMSVPLHWTKSGVPLGVQFIATAGCDLQLLQLARQLEQAKPWFERYAMDTRKDK